MKVNDTVFFWHNLFLEEGTIVMFGGINQVLLDLGGEWVLYHVDEIKLAKDVTEEEWKYLNI